MNSPSTSAIRCHGNRLAQEPSRYLQQHGHNPIDWYPWNDEALARARRKDCLIFLSVGYSSCHWCHVMEREVFQDDEVAQVLNDHFVSIKVDREEMPDLDALYMEAVQMITGQGGWPMSVFLSPDLKPVFGGTYIPRGRFRGLLDQLIEIYTHRRTELLAQSDQLSHRLGGLASISVPDAPPAGAEALEDAVSQAKDAFDPTQGGFQQSQKFPMPVRWRFLLQEYRHQRDPELAEMLTLTLEAMQGGGIRDHLAGGFHRYTVDSDWTVPHFEKMLYDNGQLAALFVEAGISLQRDDFLATGHDVLNFLIRDMRHPEGPFYASFDADSGGEEGTFYLWDADEIDASVGPQDGPLLAEYLGIVPQGNFEETGKCVLTRRADLTALALKYQVAEDYPAQAFERHRPTLRAVRDQRTAPGLDEKVVTSWNGLVIKALAQAAAKRPAYLKAAEEAADYLLENHRDKRGDLTRSSTAGRVAGDAVLDDYANLIDALLEIHKANGSPERLQEARELTDRVLRDFIRPEGGFFQTAEHQSAPLGRRVDPFDNVTPCGNSVMLHNLAYLAAETGEASYRSAAMKSLEQTAGLLNRAPFEMPWTCAALRTLLGS